MPEEDLTQGIGGPFVTVATFCERVLEEKDGVHTLVRVVDTFFIDPPPATISLPPGVKAAIQAFLMVIVKSGDFRGDATLSVRLRHPSGRYEQKPVSAPIKFDGGVQGSAVQIEMAISVEEIGLYWADVEVNGRVLTRAPLRVALRSTPPPAGGSAAPDAR